LSTAKPKRQEHFAFANDLRAPSIPLFSAEWVGSQYFIAKPGMVYPESTSVQLTRPSGSGNPAQNSTGHSNPGSAKKGAVFTSKNDQKQAKKTHFQPVFHVLLRAGSDI
jgi:hypothetical protein